MGLREWRVCYAGEPCLLKCINLYLSQTYIISVCNQCSIYTAFDEQAEWEGCPRWALSLWGYLSTVIRALSKFWSATPTWTKNPPLLSPPQTEWPWAPWTDETGLDPKVSLPKWLLLFLLLLAPTKALFKPFLFQCYQCNIEKPFSSKGERPNVEGCEYPSVIGFTCGSLWGNN